MPRRRTKDQPELYLSATQLNAAVTKQIKKLQSDVGYSYNLYERDIICDELSKFAHMLYTIAVKNSNINTPQ